MGTTQSLFEEELNQLQERELYRELKTLEFQKSAVHAKLQGRELVLFCGNDYLGLSRHPRVIEAVREGAAESGVGAGASRLIAGSSRDHERLETALARFKSKPQALLFTTGYMANVGTLTALAGSDDLIVMDKLCHASIIDGARLSGARLRVFSHLNYERCREILAKEKGHRRALLVTESVFSMDGDVADLDELIKIKKEAGALLIVDDAHATGVVGKRGKGAPEIARDPEDVDVIVGTLSKAVGVLGGFAAGRREVMEYLINVSRPFIFSTALPPALCRGAHESLRLIDAEPVFRERLWSNARRLHEGIVRMGLEMGKLQSAIVPVILEKEARALEVSKKLLIEGFFAPAIRPPTVPKGKSRLRLTISAAHTPEDIDRFLRALKRSI